MQNIKMKCKMLEVKSLTSKKGNPFYLGSFVLENGQVFKCILDKPYVIAAFSDVELEFEISVDWNQNFALKCIDCVLASK